jgi:hypothetical protein
LLVSRAQGRTDLSRAEPTGFFDVGTERLFICPI